MEGASSATNIEAITLHPPSYINMADLRPDAYPAYRFNINRKDLVQHFGKTRADAAKSLGVSVSTLKRVSRMVGIVPWPSTRTKPLQHPSFNGIREVVCSNQTFMDSFSTVGQTILNVISNQDEGNLTVKATYGEDLIRFQLTHSSGMAGLMEKVIQRLPLKEGSFKMKYKDGDGDWILIACDEDLEYCIRISGGMSTIKILIVPEAGS